MSWRLINTEKTVYLFEYQRDMLYI